MTDLTKSPEPAEKSVTTTVTLSKSTVQAVARVLHAWEAGDSYHGRDLEAVKRTLRNLITP